MAFSATEGAEIGHDAVFPEEGAPFARCRIARPNHSAALVDTRWIAPAAKRPEVGHDATLPEKRMIPGGGCADSHDLPTIIDPEGLAVPPVERPEIGQRPA